MEGLGGAAQLNDALWRLQMGDERRAGAVADLHGGRSGQTQGAQGGWGKPQQPQGGNQFSGGQQARPAAQNNAPAQNNEPPMDFDDDIPF